MDQSGHYLLYYPNKEARAEGKLGGSIDVLRMGEVATEAGGIIVVTVAPEEGATKKEEKQKEEKIKLRAASDRAGAAWAEALKAAMGACRSSSSSRL